MSEIVSPKFNSEKTGEPLVSGFSGILFLVVFIFAAGLLFAANKKIPFMMDDLWYATNISDGSPLTGIVDIIESQIWHYNFWGGRVFTHGFLQLTLMSGELCADIINVICTVLLSLEMYYLACIIAGGNKGKNLSLLFMMFGCLISLCPGFKMSMLWQAGCANYVYSSLWILFFYICYIRALDGRKDYPCQVIFMLPIGLITGWSTENMGPSAFVISLIITVYLINKSKPSAMRRIWMIEGVITSFIGSVMCIIAPGNFIRKDVSEADISVGVFERMLQMLKGAGEYLFPALLLLSGCIVLYIIKKKTIRDIKLLLSLLAAVLSYGAMVLSPHYPDRAAFGTAMLIEICAGGMLYGIPDIKDKSLNLISGLLMLSSMITMTAVIIQ